MYIITIYIITCVYVTEKRHEIENVVEHSKKVQSTKTTTVQSTQHTLTQDELLIELVRNRRGLWDHSIPLSERTKLKKDSLWEEIVNMFDGNISL